MFVFFKILNEGHGYLFKAFGKRVGYLNKVLSRSTSADFWCEKELSNFQMSSQDLLYDFI